MKSSELNKPRKTSSFKKLWSIHWIMSASYLLLYTAGITMNRIPRDIFIRSYLFDFHKSMGALVMALLTWRIFLLLQIYTKKYRRKKPKLSLDWFRNSALHTFLYMLMFIVPTSGFFLSNSVRNNNVSFLGIVLPDIFPENRAIVGLASSVHFWLAYGFLALIVLHIINQEKFVKSFWRRNISQS